MVGVVHAGRKGWSGRGPGGVAADPRARQRGADRLGRAAHLRPVLRARLRRRRLRSRAVPPGASTTWSGTPAADIGAGVTAQLGSSGKAFTPRRLHARGRSVLLVSPETARPTARRPRGAPMNRRRASWRENLARRRDERIAHGVRAQPGARAIDVTLIVVTKTYPASDVELLVELGVTDIGENRHPEAGESWLSSPGRCHAAFHRWPPDQQGERCRALCGRGAERRSRQLVEALSRGAVLAGRELGCLVQVDFGDNRPRTVRRRARAMPEAWPTRWRISGLRLDGVMTVAPLGEDPAAEFRRAGRRQRRRSGRTIRRRRSSPPG